MVNVFNFRRSKTACFCRENADGYEIYKAVDSVVSEGYENFLFCAETYIGLEFAKTVLLRKKKQTGNSADKIILVAVISDERHVDDKDELFRNDYFSVIEQCDSYIDLKNNEPLSCEKFMISKSNKII